MGEHGGPRMRSLRWMVPVLLASLAAGAAADDRIRLDKGRYLDKCKGAWAAQMAGVSFGAPTEWAYGVIGFLWMGKPNDSELEPWKPERIANAINQDDLYVEMTFLKALEEHGIGVTPAQAGKAFARTQYDLWHANLFARENLRLGIPATRSGHPRYTLHCNDIDFQIEADFIGLVCPGLPRESNRFCDTFGHIMCYGDGVYGGMFVAGMYAAAFLEDRDVRKVVEAGLACIPEKSRYRQCIADAIRWHDEAPDDWLATWRKLEDKWQVNDDCEPLLDSNINANLNGAYVVTGLLYGNGDMARTIEIATRCGQDSDCNPATAAGVLGCMKGFSKIEPEWVSGLPAIRDKKFSFSDYSFDPLVPACQRIAEQVIARAGGTVEAEVYVIPRQRPRPPRRLEQHVYPKNPVYKP